MALGIPFLYILGGLCVITATSISLVSVVQHLLYFHQPDFQRYICRILLMVPIYAVTSWFSMFFPEQKLWIASMRESYEAFAVYSFTMLLFAYVGGERRLAINLEMKEKIEHPWPFNQLFRGLYPGAAFLRLVKVGVLQFVLIRPLTAVCILAGTGLSIYHEGYFGLNDSYVYIFLLSNLSFTLAFYGLLLFFQATQDLLEPHRPVPKFLCVKLVIFLTFWQGVVIGLLEKADLIPSTKRLSNEDVGITIQEFLICLEMLAFAIAHAYAFHYQESLTRDDSTLPLKKESEVVKRITSVLVAKDVIEEVKNSWNPPPSDFEMDAADRV